MAIPIIGILSLIFVTFFSLIVFAAVGLLPTPLLSLYSYVQHYIRRKSTFAPRHKRKFNFNEIVPGVFVGTQPRNEADVELLSKECGVTAIICLNEERELYLPTSHWQMLNFKRLHIPIPDYQGPNVNQLVEAVQFVHDVRKSGGKVFIHCNGGKGRSAAVCVAYLLANDLAIESVKEAVLMVKERRKQTSKSLFRYPYTSQSRYLWSFHEENQKNPVLKKLMQEMVEKVVDNVQGEFNIQNKEKVVHGVDNDIKDKGIPINSRVSRTRDMPVPL